MKELLNIITSLHKKTDRNYLERMQNNKVECMNIASTFSKEYWDGDRRYGYGGYKYDGRWSKMAQQLIDHYDLSNESKILDVGCGKAFLLYEIKKILPGISIAGTDISSYAITHAKDEVKPYLSVCKSQERLDYQDKHFDLVISLNVLHNLEIGDLVKALSEIERLGNNKYIVTEGYRSDKELFNLQCWALTCRSFYSPNEWQWIFNHFNYTGDYEFIFFE